MAKLNMHPSLVRSIFLMGTKAPAIGYLETSANLLSREIAETVLDVACRSNDAASVEIYLRGVAYTLIGEGC